MGPGCCLRACRANAGSCVGYCGFRTLRTASHRASTTAGGLPPLAGSFRMPGPLRVRTCAAAGCLATCSFRHLAPRRTSVVFTSATAATTITSLDFLCSVACTMAPLDMHSPHHLPLQKFFTAHILPRYYYTCTATTPTHAPRTPATHHLRRHTATATLFHTALLHTGTSCRILFTITALEGYLATADHCRCGDA